jgi:NAD-dependent deacetylase
MKIVILTGAGISAESGLDTFRDADGVWSQYDLNDVATPEGFTRNPHLVHEFYNARRASLIGIKPNPAHMALARLEQEHSGDVLIVTQNVDNLHEKAGSENLIHMHGELQKIRCQACSLITKWGVDLEADTECPSCGEAGNLRPHIVWFGEMPQQMNAIGDAIAACDLFLSIGTSGNVYPAAGFVMDARAAGAHTVELNLEPSEGESYFAEKIYGPASKIVGGYVDTLLTASHMR